MLLPIKELSPARIKFSKDTRARFSAMVSAAMTFSLQVLYIYFKVQMYYNSNILDLRNSLEFTSAFHELAHITQTRLFMHFI